MLARLAATLRERHALGGGVAAVGGEGGEGATIVLDDNCNVSQLFAVLVVSAANSVRRLCDVLRRMLQVVKTVHQ